MENELHHRQGSGRGADGRGTRGLDAHKELGGRVRVRRCLWLNHDDAEKEN